MSSLRSFCTPYGALNSKISVFSGAARRENQRRPKNPISSPRNFVENFLVTPGTIMSEIQLQTHCPKVVPYMIKDLTGLHVS